jgi:5-methylthioadenosine/S-adenosylhomocysteine deaminase
MIIHDTLLIPNSPLLPTALKGWIHISGDKIISIEEGEYSPSTNPVPEDKTLIDGSKWALLPAFSNTHAHSHSSLTRGSAEGLSLAAWLEIVEREQRRLSEEDAYIAALCSYAEALLSGTGSLIDMCLFPNAAMQAANEIGLKVGVAPYVADTKKFTPSMEETVKLLERTPPEDDFVKVWCGLHDLESCSDTQIRQAVEIAEHFNAPIHMHCSETMRSTNMTKNRTGFSPVKYLLELGVLDLTTHLAHCVWVDEEDCKILAQYNASVAHCPHANLKLGSGIAPVPMMLSSGLNVSLATDGAKANNRLDMFDVMKFAGSIHRGIHNNPQLLPPEEIIGMATSSGTEILGLPSGRLEPGFNADIAFINIYQIHLQPATTETIIPNLVFSARGSDVENVMIDGSLVVKNGKLTRVDYYYILEQMKRSAEKLMAKK